MGRRKPVRRLIILAVFVILVYSALSGMSLKEIYNFVTEQPVAMNYNTNTEDPEFEQAIVSRVVDGDTIVVTINGEEKKVRFIGVDTPEVYGTKEFYGEEASNFTKDLLKEGTPVFLSKDVSDTDRYDRLLRYVWLKPSKDDPTDDMVNAILVKEGYAAPANYPPDERYKSLFEDLSERPYNNQVGLWEKAQNREARKTVAVA